MKKLFFLQSNLNSLENNPKKTIQNDPIMINIFTSFENFFLSKSTFDSYDVFDTKKLINLNDL